MTTPPTESWTSDQAYEPYVGRWSRLVALRFLDWLPGGPGLDWCDVGCGTGALSHAVLATMDPGRVLGVDPSAEYVAAARRGAADARFTGTTGNATELPAENGEFDLVVSALVLNFVPQPDRALDEMRRVTRPGGWVGAYVWDYAEGMQLIRWFWDAAVALDPGAVELDEGVRFPLCAPAPLRALFAGAGLLETTVSEITVRRVFADVDDVWAPFLGGQGPAPGYCAALPADRRDALRDRYVARLPRRADGTVALTARAWAVRGRVP
jgi:SAM-dependent methyltransferase